MNTDDNQNNKSWFLDLKNQQIKKNNESIDSLSYARLSENVSPNIKHTFKRSIKYYLYQNYKLRS